MAVCALDQDRLAVDEQLASLDLDIPEAELQVGMVRDLLLGRGGDGERVEIGGLGRPELRIRHRDAGACHILDRNGAE